MKQIRTTDDQMQVDSPVGAIVARDVLSEILRQGAQKMLTRAVENEVQEYLTEHFRQLDQNGHRLVVRNGYLPQRQIQTGIGQVAVRQPRVNDKRLDQAGQRKRFSSKILPPYLRRTRSIDELIPWLYLKGISTGGFSEALAALLGPQASGLSATNIVRLKASWQAEWKDWSSRSLKGKAYVYIWVDGIYFNVRLEDKANQRQCILVVMGATAQGWRLIPNWLSVTGLWASGPRYGRFFHLLLSNAVGRIRPPMCSTSCPRPCRARARPCCTRFGWLRARRMPRRLLICSLRLFRSSILKLLNV